MLDGDGKQGGDGPIVGGGSRPVPSGTRETLADIARRLRPAMAGAACGPLIVAADVVKLADNWTLYQAEANGRSPAEWLIKTFGKGKDLAWFTRRFEAVELIGEAARRTWHHEAAVWVVDHVRDVTHVQRLNVAVMEERKRNGNNPLTKVQVTLLAKKIGILVSKTKPHKTCGRCGVLEAALKAAGVAVPPK